MGIAISFSGIVKNQMENDLFYVSVPFKVEKAYKFLYLLCLMLILSVI